MAIAGGLFLWGQHYLTGLDEIDHQHEEITVLLNQLHEARRAGASHDQQRVLLDGLINAVAEHFQTEESLMQENGYSELDLHKLEHDALVGKVLAIRAKFDGTDDGILDDALQFVKEWLRDHMLTTDRRMGRFLAKQLGIVQP